MKYWAQDCRTPGCVEVPVRLHTTRGLCKHCWFKLRREEDERYRVPPQNYQSSTTTSPRRDE